MKKTAKALVEEAMELITTYTPEQAQALHGDPGVQFVDVRDVRELEREGVIPGAIHAPRGMLEFWVDPESPYHRKEFAQDKEYVLFCAAGWRSALATRTLMDMGLARVAHIGGGFGAWKAAGGPVAAKPSRREVGAGRAGEAGDGVKAETQGAGDTSDKLPGERSHAGR